MFRLYRAIIRLFVRTDPYPITSTFGIPSVYNDATYNVYTLCRSYIGTAYSISIIYTIIGIPNILVNGYGFVLTKRPDDGSV